MVFKLIRIDAEEPHKIQLPLGTHLIGRGKFLECEDKRISRNHGHLIITEDSVSIVALHQNPCFFTKKGSDEKQVLKKSFKEILDNGDRFGLLPDSYWYEVLHCIADTDSQATDVSNTQELGTVEECSTNHENTQHKNRASQDINHETSPHNDMAADKIINHENGPHDRSDEEKITNNENSKNERTVSGVDATTSDTGKGDNEDSFVNFDLNETVDNGSPGRAESPSLLDQENDPQHDSANQSMELALPTPDPTTTDNPDPPEPSPETPTEQQEPPHQQEGSKRSHSLDGDDAVKRIKTEPVDVKQEVKQELDDGQAGPSSSQADQAVASTDAGGSKAPPSPVPAAPRERCIYGAQCYRRNPLHKAQFAHPTDPDWGSGDKAPCPYGAACRKRDPRHWQVHEHPPQARPPAPVPRPKPRAKPKKRMQHSSDSDSSPGDDLVLATKRPRKPLPKWDGDSEGEDPYASDGSDDWVPPSDYTETPDY